MVFLEVGLLIEGPPPARLWLLLIEGPPPARLWLLLISEVVLVADRMELVHSVLALSGRFFPTCGV
jgi:hypothetical protein